MRAAPLTYVNLALAAVALLAALPSALQMARDVLSGWQPNDFANYYLAAAILNSDVPDLYGEALLATTAAARGVTVFATPYCYPPVFAAALRPLATLAYAPASALWLLLNSACLGLSAALLVRLAGFRLGWRTYLAGALVVALFPPVHQALRLGQVSPLLLLLCAGALYLALEVRSRAGEAIAGGLVALATMTKVFPGLLLVYLAASRRARMLVYAVGGLAVCLLLGIGLARGLANTWAFFGTVLPSLYGERLAVLQPDNQALPAFFLRMFTPVSYPIAMRGPDDWHLITLTPLAASRALAMGATYVATALLLVLTGIAALRHGAGRPADGWALGYAMTLLVSLLVVSCTYYHLYVMLLLPLAVLVRVGRARGWAAMLTVAPAVYALTAVQRYANWLVLWTSSAWLASFGLYAALLLWGALYYLDRRETVVEA